ncbi:MAG: hypothetical protein PQJ59_16445 [Spirochaetales bacterium]|nr:hypothetical protein [Spirochaetales bacterium]
MNTLVIILVETGIILLGGYVGYKILQAKNKKISDLNSALEKEKRVSKALQDHMDRKLETVVELEPIKEQVREATSEKEVLEAIASIVAINNSIVQDD